MLASTLFFLHAPRPLLFPQLTKLGPVHCVSYSSGIGQYVSLPTNPPPLTHNSLTKPTDPDRRLGPEECAPPPPPSSPLPLANSSPPLSSHAHKPHDRYPPPILHLTRLRSSLPQYLSGQQHLCLRWRRQTRLPLGRHDGKDPPTLRRPLLAHKRRNPQ